MGRALELISCNTVNPGATFTAATAAVGDSLVVRNFPQTARARIENMWSRQTTAGALRVRSPRIHDNVSGIRANILAADPIPVLPDWTAQTVYPQDTLIVEQTGGAAETEVAVLMLSYEDLPGTDARLFRWEEISARIVNYVGVLVAPTTSATIGAWGPGRALNADNDVLKANVDYALLGYDVDASCAGIAIRGVDTGNLRVGGPGTTNRIDTRDWFVRQSIVAQAPFIPVFNAANKGSILVDGITNAASVALNINFLLAELSG